MKSILIYLLIIILIENFNHVFLTLINDQITCNIGAGTGVKDISITQSGYTWFAQNAFEYVVRPNIPNTCSTNCSNRGYCGDNHCICNSNYWGDNFQYGN
ncbi:hypothetical protein RB653_008607 [Dictyostelium firmibasis]|uniref:Tenascin EGF-like domain-containing protein n=1 Tax=Dictyostelium firmibasis TaxID=79012 RepID=A0AAN7YWQ6_9MYCE